MKVYQLQTNAEKIDDFFNNEGNCLLDITNILPTSFDIQIKDLENLIHYDVAAANQKIYASGISFGSDDTISIVNGTDLTITSDPVMKTVVINSTEPPNQTIVLNNQTFDKDATVRIVSDTNEIYIYNSNNNLYIDGSTMTSFLEITNISYGIYTMVI